MYILLCTYIDPSWTVFVTRISLYYIVTNVCVYIWACAIALYIEIQTRATAEPITSYIPNTICTYTWNSRGMCVLYDTSSSLVVYITPRKMHYSRLYYYTIQPGLRACTCYLPAAYLYIDLCIMLPL